MDLPDVMDQIKTHAAAGALAIDAKFKDVAVGHPTPRGRSVRVYYGGEAEVEHFTSDRTQTSKLIAQRVLIRAFWPVSEYAAKRGRALMLEMGSFVKELRTRVLGDSQLNSESSDLNMHFADADDMMIGGVLFAIIDAECVVEYDEYTIAK